MQKNTETYIIEQIVLLSERIKKIGESKIFLKAGLTTLQFNILGVILGDKINSVNGIKRKLIVSSASLSQTINRMVMGGFIKRALGENDKREILLIPTRKGIESYNRLNDEYIRITTKVLSEISKQDQMILLDSLILLDKLIDKGEKKLN
ncbi:MAG: MarR family transcriptional regulator [Candidatus Absconditabacteria bacterium]